MSETKSKARPISQPADWWAAFERQASLEGLTLSEWIGEACKARIQSNMKHGLTVYFSQRQKPGRKADPVAIPTASSEQVHGWIGQDGRP